MGGHIRMQRGWRDHSVFRNAPYSHRDAWGWLIESACWKPLRFDVGGTTVTIERGQLCYSVRQLAERWRWSKTTVTRFLSRLKAEKMIQTCSKTGTPTGTGKTIITVCNYSIYQAEPGEGGTPSGTNVGQKRDIKEEGKERKETSPKGEDAKASPTHEEKSKPEDSAKGVFDLGKSMLAEYGFASNKAGGLISKWRKQIDDAILLEIIREADSAKRHNIVEYIQGCIRYRKNSDGPEIDPETGYPVASSKSTKEHLAEMDDLLRGAL